LTAGGPGGALASTSPVSLRLFSHRLIEGREIPKVLATCALGIPRSTASNTFTLRSFEYALMQESFAEDQASCKPLLGVAMDSGIAPDPDANPASPKRSAPESSPFSPKTHRASSSQDLAADCGPQTRRGQPTLDFGHARRERPRDGHRDRAQPGAAHPACRGRPLAQHEAVGRERLP
jgi:hypothetical protein